ncbi:MAG: glycosyltransferase family 4 protein, partial [Candidatus Binatia bacterium]
TFTGSIDHDRVNELYAESEVAVVPSLYEGFSLPAVQAMASGLALVCTTAGAIPEVAGTDGDTALLVSPGDAAALAQALKRALEDGALRARLGDAARRRVFERFTWKQTAIGTAEQYRKLIDAC